MEKNQVMDKRSSALLKRSIAIVICVFFSVVFLPATASAATKMPAETKSAVPDFVIEDNDELLWGYLNKEIAEETGTKADSGRRMLRARKAPRSSQLTEKELIVYNSLKSQIEKLLEPEDAEGYSETVFFVPASAIFNREIKPKKMGKDLMYEISSEEYEILDKQINGIKTVQALGLDMPYELFWFDKTKTYGYETSPDGYLYEGSDNVYFESEPGLLFTLKVSKDYSRSGSADTTQLDNSKISSVKNAIATAGEIINSAEGYAYSKLCLYNNEICRLTEYNHEAAKDTSKDKYGDPWQLVYVFDGIESTKVVCEGYSKAFQFLCDNTPSLADEGVDCHTVTGDLIDSSGSGPHMWNVVRMDDGLNYLADITNSDAGSKSNNILFLKGVMTANNSPAGYQFDYFGDGFANLEYAYDDKTKELYTESERKVEDHSYDPKDVWTFKGFTWEGSETEGYTSAAGCYERTTDATITKEVTADLSVSTTATCLRGGVNTYTATMTEAASLDNEAYSEEKTATVQALGHDWGEAAYEWSSNNRKVTASRSCGRDGCKEKEEEIVDATIEVTKPPTCEAKGEMTYTSAAFSNEAFTVQTKTEANLNALGHDWGEWVVTTPATETSEGIETRICRIDPTHTEKRRTDKLTPEPVPVPVPKPFPEPFPEPASVPASDPVASVGTRMEKSGNVFKVTSAENKTVEFSKAKNVRSITVPAVIRENGVTYEVTTIKAGAFKGNKIRTVTVGKNIKKIEPKAFKGSKAVTLVLKTKALEKKSVRNSLKGSRIASIRVKVGNKKENKKYVTKYKKIFTKKNAGKAAKVS